MLNIIAFKLGAIHLLRSHGGGEVRLKKWPIFANYSTDKLREMQTKGGGGLEILRT